MTKIRKKLRLPNYDYSYNGIYFITVCAFQRRNIFSFIEMPKEESSVPALLHLKGIGKVCDEVINSLQHSFPEFKLISKVIMPNHVHVLLWIDNNLDRPSRSLSDYVSAWKREVSRRTHKLGYKGNVWQKSFYDHIVRNEEDMLRIMQYIDENPQKWALDRFYIE